MIDTDHVATQITDLLTHDGTIADATGQTPRSGPNNPAAAGRSAVVAAVELLIITLNTSRYDALTLLRARAYATDQSVDTLAADILQGRIPIDEFRPDTPTD